MRFSDLVLTSFMAGIAFTSSAAANVSLCDTKYLANGISLPTVRIDPSVSHKFYLGLNLEVVPFELRLWKAAHADENMVKELMAMPGTLLRYPGGSVANRIDLVAAMGSKENRRGQLLAQWAGRRRVEFGPLEFQQFTQRVRAKPWFVANLWGDDAGLKQQSVMEKRFLSVLEGWPAGDIPGYIELGNELYLPHWEISADAYGRRAAAAADMLKEHFPGTIPVVGLVGLDGRREVTAFNQTVVSALGNRAVDFALHYYHDGPPGGPPLEAIFTNICSRIKWLASQRGVSPRLWITEQARWPGGRVTDPNWASTWSKSFDLRAAISSAEFTLAAARIPEISGVFLHALGGVRGPWRTFVESVGGELTPSAPMVAQQLLFALAEGDVLDTWVESPGLNRNALLQATGYRRKSGEIGLLMTNRANETLRTRVSIVGLANTKQETEIVVLTGDAMTDDKPAEEGKTGFRSELRHGIQEFNEAGTTEIDVPARSVTKIQFLH